MDRKPENRDVTEREPDESDLPELSIETQINIKLLAWKFVNELLNNVQLDLSIDGIEGLQNSLEEYFIRVVQEIIAHNLA